MGKIELTERVVDQLLFSFLGEMMGAIAHDLNNPLMVIMGKSDMISRGVEAQKWDDSRVIDSAGKIMEASQRMSRLIEVFRQLSVSRENIQERSMTLSQLVDDLELLFKKKLSYFGGLIVKHVEGDAEKTYSIYFMKLGLSLIPWMNFISEFLKESDGGKEIHLKVREEGEHVELNLVSSVDIEPIEKFDHPETYSEKSKEVGLNMYVSQEANKFWGAELSVVAWSPFSLKVRWPNK